MLIILMLILVVPFAFVQQINNNLYVLDILCLDHFYFAGVPRIIVFSRVPHTLVSSRPHPHSLIKSCPTPHPVVLGPADPVVFLRECRSPLCPSLLLKDSTSLMALFHCMVRHGTVHFCFLFIFLPLYLCFASIKNNLIE